MPDYNWPAIAKVARELLETEEFRTVKELRNAVSVELGTRIPKTTFKRGIGKIVGGNFFSIRELRTLFKTTIIEEKPSGGSEHISKEEYPNDMIVETRTHGIKTLDALLEAGEVDREVWRVERWVLNKWPVGAKAEYKNLHFNQGVITGTIKADGLTIAELWQVKAWLIRRKPISVFPTVQPVTCSASYQKPDTTRKGICRSLILADAHLGFRRNIHTGQLTPFHDRRAMDIALQLVDHIRPDRIDLIGDELDLPDWSDKFLKSPEFYWTTQPAILELFWWLHQIREAYPDADMVYYEGNHCQRMERAILTHLPAAYDLRSATEMELPPTLSIPRLLAFDELGIRWVSGYPNNEEWLNSSVCVTHGDTALKNTTATAKSRVDTGEATEVFGHVHRIELASKTPFRGREAMQPRYGFCPGCLCRIDGYVPGHNPRRQSWQQGIGLVEYETDGTGHTILPIPVYRGRALWDGKLFVGRDRMDDLRKDLPEWKW